MKSVAPPRITGGGTLVVRTFPVWQILLLCVLSLAPLFAIPRVVSDAEQRSWEHISSWPGDGAVQQIVAVPIAGGGTALYAASASGGLYWSGDDGQRWFRMSHDLPRDPLDQTRIIDLALDPEDARTIHLVVTSGYAFPTPMVYWTVDMGLNWQPRASLGRERVRAIAYGADRSDLYVLTNSDLLEAFVIERETGDGATARQETAIPADNVYWVSIAPFDPQTWVTDMVVVRVPSEAFAATLAGQVPETFRSRVSTAARPPEDADHLDALYIGTQAAGLRIIIHSAEGAFPLDPTDADPETTFVRQQATIHTIGVDSSRPQRIYAGTDRGLYLSQDGGISWDRVGAGTLRGPVLAFLSDPLDRDTMYVGTASDGVFASQDGGLDWKPLGYGLRRSYVDALAIGQAEGERALYAGTRNGIWRLSLPD